MTDTAKVQDFDDLPSTAFGFSPAVEERLAALILAGRKRATVWDGTEPNVTAPGMRWRVTASGRDVAVIETVTVSQARFDEIDAAFAAQEGEGDGSLAFWRIVHERYFREMGQFAPDMLLWCETFRLVAVLDPVLAEAAKQHVQWEEEEAQALLAAHRDELHPPAG